MSASVSAFDQYARGAWERFVGNPARAQVSLETLEGIEVKRVLDVGCGAGHELLPFASEGAFAVGLDLAPEGGSRGREPFAAQGHGARSVCSRRGRSAAFYRRDIRSGDLPPGAAVH